MIREQTLRARQKLISKMPITGELLRGSLLDRTVRHSKDCPKCARGEGHRVFVLTVTYPGQRTRQFSVRRERVAEVRRWLSNYRELREAIEAACELKMPDAKTMGRWGLALGPGLKQIHERIGKKGRDTG